MPGFEVLLPTGRLYQLPSFDDFNEIKQQWIAKNLERTYHAMPAREKWTRLITKFITILPANHDHQSTFNRFRAQRLDSANGQSTLSLTDCINYFEHFIFIYSTANSDDQLRMLLDIMAGMEDITCEAGRRTQFENALYQYRTDTEWIPVELHHHRKNILRSLADEYNAENRISDVYSIHTIMHMEKLAAAANLGFKPLGELTDIHIRNRMQPIEAYFHRYSVAKFVEYERDIAQNLANHLMRNVFTWAREQGVTLDNWATNRPILNKAQMESFIQLIKDFLDNDIISLLAEDNDYYTITLHVRLNFEETIKNWVNKKLIDDGYFVKITSSIPCANNLSQANIRLPQGVTQDQFDRFLKALNLITNAPNSLMDASHSNVLVQYPIFLRNLLRQYPDFWFQLTKSDKSNILLIDACIVELTHLLLLNTGNDVDINRLIATLFTITQSNSDYLITLPPQLMVNKLIVKALVKKSGLLLSHASAELRNTDEIIDEARIQYPKADIYSIGAAHVLYDRLTELSDQLPIDLKMTTLDENTSAAYKGRMIQRMENITALLTTAHISPKQLIKLSQLITPAELILIMHHRTQCQPPLPALPHCNEAALTAFYSAVSIDGAWRWDGYMDLKRNIAAAPTVLNQTIAHQAITESNQWFLAFMSYQKQRPMIHARFESLTDTLWQLKLSGLNLLNIMGSILKILAEITNILMLVAYYISLTLILFCIGTLFAVIASSLIINLGVLPIIGFGVMCIIAVITWSSTSLTPALFDTAFFITVMLLADPVGISFVIAVGLQFFMLIGLIGFIAKAITILSVYNSSFNEVVQFLRSVGLYINNALSNMQQRANASDGVVGGLMQEISLFLFYALVPWITRPWATLTATNVDPRDMPYALKSDVENSIYRLHLKDEPSAQKKASLLEALWDNVEDDVQSQSGSITYREALNKTYPVDGSNQALSFWQVASTRRHSSRDFKVESTPSNSSFSFFGKPTTAETLTKYVDFNPEQAAVA